MGNIVGAGLGAIGSIAGGIAGANAGAGDKGEARNQSIIANQILQQLANAPDISKPLILQQYKQAGILTPEMEQQISAGPSAVATIGTDQQSLDAQRQALTQAQQRSTQGMTAGDRAALAQAQQGAQADTQSKIAQIEQKAQAQMGGAGQTGRTLAAQLAAAQGGSNQEFSNANQVAQMAQQNALNASSQLGTLGGQINQQQFGQAAEKANATDQMNRFNVQNQIAAQQRNVGASNQAQAANLANLQSLNNQNVGGQNQELNNQLQRQMQQFQGNNQVAQIKAGGAQNEAGTLANLGQQSSQNAYNSLAGAGQVAGGLLNAFGKKEATAADLEKDYKGGVVQYHWTGGQIPGGGMQNFTGGGFVPGEAKMSGDHPANDTVHAMVSPGEIVVPRSLADSKLGRELVKLIKAHHSVKNKLNGND